MTVHPPAAPAGRASAGSPQSTPAASDRRSRADGQPGAHSPGPWRVHEGTLCVYSGDVCDSTSRVMWVAESRGFDRARAVADLTLAAAALPMLAAAKFASGLLGRAMHDLPLLGNQDVHSALCRALQELGAAVAVAEPESQEGGEAIAEGAAVLRSSPGEHAVATGGAPRAIGRAQQFEIEEPSREESQP